MNEIFQVRQHNGCHIVSTKWMLAAIIIIIITVTEQDPMGPSHDRPYLPMSSACLMIVEKL